MNKPLAVIDKCLFQEICAVESESERERHWSELYSRYQLVVPYVLLAEVIANVARPGKTSQLVLERMKRQLTFLRACWMEDVTEIAFMELVESRPLVTVPTPSDATVPDLLSLRREDPSLVQWSNDRVCKKRETARMRKAEQERLMNSTSATHVGSYREFFDRTVRIEFIRALEDDVRKRDFLENVFGEHFRERHNDAEDRIDAAFKNFGPKTFSRYPFTTNYLTVRLAYLFAPAVSANCVEAGEPKRIIRGTAGDQFNNAEDEQYLVSALVCARLLTRDSGLDTMARVFRDVGLWKGQPVFLEAGGNLIEQIPELLE